MKSMDNAKRRVVLAAAALILVTCCGWLIWSRQPVPLPQAAKNYSNCVRALDSSCLFSISSDQERAALALDQKKLDSLIKTYLAPRLLGVRKELPAGKNFNQDNLQLVYFGYWAGPRQVTTTGVIYASPRGPRASVVEDLVILGMNLDAAKHNPQGTDETIHAQTLPFLDQQIADLKATGLPGYFEASTGKLIKWDVLEANIRRLGDRQLRTKLQG